MLRTPLLWTRRHAQESSGPASGPCHVVTGGESESTFSNLYIKCALGSSRHPVRNGLGSPSVMMQVFGGQVLVVELTWGGGRRWERGS